LEIVQPQVALMVLDPAVPEFKPSAKWFMGRATAFVARGPLQPGSWDGAADELAGAKPVFEQRLGEPLPEGLLLLIRNRLFAAVHPGTT